MTDAKKDRTDEARRLLAEVETDIRLTADKVHQLRTAGAEHFRSRLEWAHKRGLTPGNVDAWCREAAGVAAVTE